MEHHYRLPRDTMIRSFLIFVLFQVGSTQNKDNDFSIGYAKKTWFEYFEDCDLESFPPYTIASMGWAAGIYLKTNWMAFEGCYDILFYSSGMTSTPLNSSMDATTACSNICKHNVFFAYKESRCFCYENHDMNQKQNTNKCNSGCKCGHKAYYVVYKHFQEGRQRPQGDKDQNFTCSATIKGFGSYRFAVNCDSCRQGGYTCAGITRRRYLQWANNFTTEELINLTTGLDNLYCLFIDNKNEQYKITELPCNKRTHSHCEIKHSGVSDVKMTSENDKSTQIDITTVMGSPTIKDLSSFVYIVETTSATPQMGSSENVMASEKVKTTHIDTPTLIRRTTEVDLASRVATVETKVSLVTYPHVWIWFLTSVGCLVILMIGVFGLVLSVRKQGHGSVGSHGRGTSRIYLAALEDENYRRVYNTTAEFDNNTDPLADEERNQYSDPLYAYAKPSAMQTNAEETSTADPQHTYDEPCPIQTSAEEGGMADLPGSYEEPSPIQTNAEESDMIYLAGSYNLMLMNVIR